MTVVYEFIEKMMHLEKISLLQQSCLMAYMTQIKFRFFYVHNFIACRDPIIAHFTIPRARRPLNAHFSSPTCFQRLTMKVVPLWTSQLVLYKTLIFGCFLPPVEAAATPPPPTTMGVLHYGTKRSGSQY